MGIFMYIFFEFGRHFTLVIFSTHSVSLLSVSKMTNFHNTFNVHSVYVRQAEIKLGAQSAEKSTI